jgi:beta-lactamase superfamily II metal-dependent hydrolase
MSTLTVRAYNVRFGDAILVIVPDRDPATKKETTRHILIDVGNVLNKEGGDDSVFEPVVKDILRELDGRPLDLYVMTHEHLDHVQGLYHAASKVFGKGELKKKLATQHAWLTASAAEDYYKRFPKAREQKKKLQEAWAAIAEHLQALPLEAAAPYRALLANNDPRNTTQCVDFLRTLAPKARTHYVFAGCKLDGRHPFREAEFAIWGPQEDTSTYYRNLLPMALATTGVAGNSSPPGVAPEPPRGVDAGAFYDLVAMRANGLADNLLSIDKAANNTSVVFLLTWRGWKLLFPGDAELASWKTMQAEGHLEPVHFLKVAHHGSHNGTPDGDVLEGFLPAKPADKRKRKALVSTWDNTYSGIPNDPTDKRIVDRCSLVSTLVKRDELFVEHVFEG